MGDKLVFSIEEVVAVVVIVDGVVTTDVDAIALEAAAANAPTMEESKLDVLAIAGSTTKHIIKSSSWLTMLAKSKSADIRS